MYTEKNNKSHLIPMGATSQTNANHKNIIELPGARSYNIFYTTRVKSIICKVYGSKSAQSLIKIV